jgi:hypothetical protein
MGIALLWSEPAERELELESEEVAAAALPVVAVVAAARLLVQDVVACGCRLELVLVDMGQQRLQADPEPVVSPEAGSWEVLSS